MRTLPLIITAGWIGHFGLMASTALAYDYTTGRLLAMSLEELSNIEGTSVSKSAEKAREAAAAVFVITQEDIKRSGAATIPDILRIVPGVQVAQAGSHDWAVSVRGFNSQFANKLLVLIDGRTVYNPAFSGTFWESQDTLLEDIERIEVIRGPGATQWGANAVNGVINIITKNAQNTLGGFATVAVGNKLRTDNSVRYGGSVGEASYARIYAKYTDHAGETITGIQNGSDPWRKRQAGFRSDSQLSNQDTLTVQGDVYDVDGRAIFDLPQRTVPYLLEQSDRIFESGGNMLARWTSRIDSESTTTTQAYLDNTQHANGYARYNTTTADSRKRTRKTH